MGIGYFWEPRESRPRGLGDHERLPGGGGLGGGLGKVHWRSLREERGRKELQKGRSL